MQERTRFPDDDTFPAARAVYDGSMSIHAGDSFEDRTFEDLALTGGSLGRKEFVGCMFVRCQLGGAELDGCHFERCRFKSCDLGVASIADARLIETRFEDCRLGGIDWMTARSLVFSVGFERCDLTHASFVGVDLTDTQFIDCRAIDVAFMDSNLTGCCFDGTTLKDSRFETADFTRADMSGATDLDVEPSTNRFKDTKVSLDAGLAILRKLGVVVGG